MFAEIFYVHARLCQSYNMWIEKIGPWGFFNQQKIQTVALMNGSIKTPE